MLFQQREDKYERKYIILSFLAMYQTLIHRFRKENRLFTNEWLLTFYYRDSQVPDYDKNQISYPMK